MPSDTVIAGLTVRDVARRLRVGADKVRGWIARGELLAVNTATRGKPRYVILPEELAAYERTLAVGSRPPVKRRKKRETVTDFYAD
jgi:excisionase family DNA binding protein